MLMAQVVSARAIYNIECRTCNMCKNLVSLINHGFAHSIVDQCVEKKSLHCGA